MSELTPYLSVVVTARNDDHGGNLLRRMQTFVNAWICQSNRHGLRSELIVVEWNPPPNRPPLREALTWPADLGACTVRFIEVPAHIHLRYTYAEVLPLYQMIAKNVGIRKSRAPFVLATNIDILFSDELVRYFAEHQLSAGRMYRIDRYDVASDVPVDGSIEERLAYCRAHTLRVNAREGTYKLTLDGLRSLEDQDIAVPESGIVFGPGWFPVERWSQHEVFRWVADDAELLVRVPTSPAPMLVLELEAGPGVGCQPFLLQLIGESGHVEAETEVEVRTSLTIHMSADGPPTRRLRLRVLNGGLRAENDPRILNFRVFRCSWDHSSSPDAKVEYVMEARPSLRRAPSVIPSLASKLAKGYRFYMQAGGLWKAGVAATSYYIRTNRCRDISQQRRDIVQPGSGIRVGNGWYPVENYLGETFRWARKDAELFIQTPKSARRSNLVMVVEPGPGVAYQPFELVIKRVDGSIAARECIKELRVVDIAIPLDKGTTQVLKLTLEGGDLRDAEDPRILNFRVFWCGWGRAGIPVAKTSDPRREDEPTAQKRSGDQPAISVPGSPVHLHTNGCGDFTLMAREHWFDLRGYPEFDLFSMNLDSVLCYAAHHAGFREHVLEDPMRIYHIEHQTGSGWTPEGQAALFARLAAKGLPFLDYQQVVGWAAQMQELNSPMIFNRETWGLEDQELPETVLSAGTSVQAAT
jgi:hypothetical protein